jgi:hypothetical protein
MSFLSSSSLLICQLGAGASLNVVSWGLGLSGDKDSTLQLRLPAVRERYLYTRIQHHSNPSPSPQPQSREEVNSEPPRKRRKRLSIPNSRTFVASGEDRLLAFSTNIQKRSELDFTHTTGYYYLFFLSEKRLKAYLKSLDHVLVDRKEGIGTEPRTLEWSEWGPEQARWIPSARTYGWAVCSRGMRFVCSPPVDHGMGFNSQVMLLDFHVPEEGVGCANGWNRTCTGNCCLGDGVPGTGKLAEMTQNQLMQLVQLSRTPSMTSILAAGTPSPFSWPGANLPPVPLPSNAMLVTGRSVLPDTARVFEKEVESSLPYLQVISEEWLMDSVGFMMDEESIVSVKVSEHVSSYLFLFLLLI